MKIKWFSQEERTIAVEDADWEQLNWAESAGGKVRAFHNNKAVIQVPVGWSFRNILSCFQRESK